jgi:hypothetical protein
MVKQVNSGRKFLNPGTSTEYWFVFIPFWQLNLCNVCDLESNFEDLYNYIQSRWQSAKDAIRSKQENYAMMG